MGIFEISVGYDNRRSDLAQSLVAVRHTGNNQVRFKRDNIFRGHFSVGASIGYTGKSLFKV
ncbi:hypothetical protein D3C85_1799330 [compost metagenome]